MIVAALLTLGAYVSGSIPSGLLITRWRTGTDVREQGSGNIGATNVARVAGKGLGVVVLLLDAAKGAVPVLLSMKWLPGETWLHALLGLAAFLGHVFPPWLKFRGGKGVATAFGVLLVLVPFAAAIGFVVYAGIFAARRVSSIGSLFGGLATVIAAVLLDRPEPYVVLAIVLFLLMLFTHRANIGRLIRRTEKAL